MRLRQLKLHRKDFDLVLASRDVQAVLMTLKPGDSTDDAPSNEHPHSEQWLYVLSGSGTALVGRSKRRLRKATLRRNSLLLIEKGELHQIRNTGRTVMTTLNFYMPPGYRSDGEPR